MKFSPSALYLVFLAATEVTSFVPLSVRSIHPPTTAVSSFVPQQRFALDSSSSSETAVSAVDKEETEDPLGLTDELRKLTNAFEQIDDDKLRYKQLLYMASNGLEPMPESLKIDENKVLGCLSTVHVHATASYDQDKDQTMVTYTGDSDGLLTKGLVALLVRGLSGNTPEAIQKVDAAFVQVAGISQSLTPGRNNGFLNMLALMKQKAKQVAESGVVDAKDEEENNVVADSDSDRPMYNGIVTTLQALKPTALELVDNSHQHAGHAGNPGNGTETHFQLTIVAEAFDGLNLVKRHQLVYMMLGQIMPQIHALQIQAMTPQEADDKQQ